MFSIIKLYHLYNLFNLYRDLHTIQNATIKIDNCDYTIKKLKKIKHEILIGGCLEIKFAQWFISRVKSNVDYNSKYLVNYFEDIFEQCPRHELEDTFNMFKNDFNFNMEEVIDLKTLECIASGSVGQVYKGKLHNPIYIVDTSHKNIMDILNSNNLTIEYVINDIWLSIDKIPKFIYPIIKKVEYVAIKVKHPKVNDDVKYKIECFNILKNLQSYSRLKNTFGLHVDFNDFIDNILQQINFNNEYINCYKFKKNFIGNYLNEFPRVLWSSYNITITEFISSKCINELPDYSQLKICLNLGCAITKMVLLDNFCHGDIHEKNWGIIDYKLENNEIEPKIIYYDYGICFTSHSKEFNNKLWNYFEKCDIDKILELTNEMIIGDYKKEDIQQELDIMLQHFKENSIDIVHLMYNLNSILEKHNCKLSSILLNLIIILSLIDSTLKKHNLIGRNSEIRKNHYIVMRDKTLDMMAYCVSKNIFPNLIIYFKKKRQTLSLLNDNIIPFEYSSTLELDLPE